MAGSSKPHIDEEHNEQDNAHVKEFGHIEELQGKLSQSDSLDKLMKSVLENDKETIDQGNIISDGLNQGLHSFTPDLLFEQFTKDYKNTKKISGERFIRELSGYDSQTIERNARIPEFQRELKSRLEKTITSLKEKGLLTKEGFVTQEGFLLAMISTVKEELDKLKGKGLLGEKNNKARSNQEGEKADVRPYRKGDRYRSINIKASAKKSIRRGRTTLESDELLVHDYENKERATIIYAIDCSGSMKGQKLGAAKRAGIALAYKATRKNDKVGCITFGNTIQEVLAPTKDFKALVSIIMNAQASHETDIASTIKHAMTLLDKKGLRHLILLTDGLHTTSSNTQVIEAAANASQSGITISVIGLNLDEQGEELSKRIVDVGKGTLYQVKNYKDLDVLLIEEYYRLKR